MLVKYDQNESGTLVQCGLQMTKRNNSNRLKNHHRHNFFDIEAILDPKSVLNGLKIVHLTDGIQKTLISKKRQKSKKAISLIILSKSEFFPYFSCFQFCIPSHYFVEK